MKRISHIAWLALLLAGVGCIVVTEQPPANTNNNPGPEIVKPDEEKLDDLPAPPPMPMGYNPNPQGTQTFLESLDKPTIREAGPELFKPVIKSTKAADPSTPDKSVLLYRALQKSYYKKYNVEFVVVNQEIGDCVSHAWSHGIAIATAVEDNLGNISEWHMPASEAVYGGSRVEGRGLDGSGRSPVGGMSDGSYGAAAAKWVHSVGGVLFRNPYEKFDLSRYSGKVAKAWGAYGCGGQGDQGWADKESKKHPVLRVALVRTFDEAAAAIKSGYPVPVCSMQGFTQQRDKDGFAAPSGSWSHAMCFVGVRFDRPGLLCLNSWGPRYHVGPKWPEDQLDGTFWVDEKVANKMLGREDSFAVSAADGFPARPLDHTDWVSVKNTETHYVLAP